MSIVLAILLSAATARATPPDTQPAARAASPAEANAALGAGGLTGLLARSALAAGAAVVVVVLIARRYGRGSGAAAGGMLAVVERLRLEPRRTLYVVRAGKRSILLASTERGIARLGPLVDRRVAGRTMRAGRLAARRAKIVLPHARRAFSLRVRDTKPGASA